METGQEAEAKSQECEETKGRVRWIVDSQKVGRLESEMRIKM